jgi:chaperonin cofactor prefoldin
MTENRKSEAREVLQQQLDQLESKLKAVLKDRREAERAVEESRKTTEELMGRCSEIANDEGTLRKQIGDLQNAMQALKP